MIRKQFIKLCHNGQHNINFDEMISKKAIEFKSQQAGINHLFDGMVQFYQTNSAHISNKLLSQQAENSMKTQEIQKEHENTMYELKKKNSRELAALSRMHGEIEYATKITHQKNMERMTSTNDVEFWKFINEFFEKDKFRMVVDKKIIDDYNTKIANLLTELSAQKTTFEKEKELLLSNEQSKYNNMLEREREKIDSEQCLEIVKLKSDVECLNKLLKKTEETLQSCKLELVAQRELTKDIAQYTSRNLLCDGIKVKS